MTLPRTLGIVANLSKQDAVPRARELLSILREAGLAAVVEGATAQALGCETGPSLLETAAVCDMLIVLGGDGTILHTARQLGARVKPMAGLNLGHLGFMTTARECQAQEVVEAIATGRFGISHRSLLEVTFTDSTGQERVCCGLNEVALTRGSISRSIHVEILADGVPLNRFSGDGVILATPTGSTAYSLSAGGPLVTPDARVFVVTAICPHTLTSRAIVLPDNVQCELRAPDSREEILLAVDGGEPVLLKTAAPVRARRAAHTVPLVTLPGSSFFQILQDKLRWMGSNL